MGSITTKAMASVTIQYDYHEAPPQPQFLPEPGGFVLWGLGGVSSLLIWGSRRRV